MNLTQRISQNFRVLGKNFPVFDPTIDKFWPILTLKNGIFDL